MTVRVPVAAPVAVGLKVTPMVHVELAATDVPQVPVLVTAKGAVAELMSVCAVVVLLWTVNENVALV